jgi:hypothetical protein
MKQMTTSTDQREIYDDYHHTRGRKVEHTQTCFRAGICIQTGETISEQSPSVAGEATARPWETSVVSSDDGDQWDICEAGAGDMIADLSECGDSATQQANARLVVTAVE